MLCAAVRRFGVLLTTGLMLFVNLDAYANSKVIKGVGLAESLKIDVDLRGYDYLVVTASQKSADYMLALSSNKSTDVFRRVNILWHKALDEVLFVTKDDCNKCVVVLEAANEVDKNSPYLVDLRFGSYEDGTSLSRDISVVKALSEAGEARSESLIVDTILASEKKAAAVQTLEQVVKVNSRTQWQLHAKTALLQLASSIYSADKLVDLAEDIVGRPNEKASTYRSQALYHLGRLTPNFDNKSKLFRQGMTEAKEAGELVDYAKGASYYAVGLTRESKFDDALSLFESVETIYSGVRNHIELIPTLSNLSWANQRAGNFPQAISFAVEHKLLAEEYSLERQVVWALYNLAIAYAKLGDSYSAEKFLDEAFSRFRAMKEADKERNITLYGYLLRERAESSFRLGDFNTADDYAQQMHDFYLKNKMNARLAAVTFLRAEIAFSQQRTDAARVLFNSAIEYDRVNGRSRSAGRNYLRLAELELKQNQTMAAVPLNVAALRALSETEDHVLLAQNFSFTVELLSSLGAFEEADQFADKVAKFVATWGFKTDQAKFLFRRATAIPNKQQNDRALSYLSEARSIIEQALPKVKRRDLRRHFLALQKSIFALNVDILLEEGKPKHALHLVESYKARTLNEVIRRVRSESNVPNKVSKARSAIHDKILASASHWYRNKGEGEAGLLASTRELSAALEKIETDLFVERDLASQRDQASAVLALPKVNQNDQLIAYYFTSVSKSWLWLIGDNKTTLHQLPGSATLQGLVSEVREHISVHPRSRGGSSAWKQRKAIIDLSGVIIDPIAKRLEESSTSHLIIVADGPLNGLSFSPLMLDQWSDPLISKVAITYAPSFGSMQAIEERANTRPPSTDKKILVLANPISTAEAEDTFAPLPNTALEAEAIQEVAGSNALLLIAENATKDRFLSKLGEQYSILHFATHGLLNNVEPALSGLTFSKVSESDISYWLVPEISSARINADLVVLSACESSIGVGIAGEGLLSLSRAFIEGGASQVIGTLWQVQDKATANLTSRFYSALLDDSLVAAEALRQAQIAVYSDKNNDWRDPYFWAGFQLQGGWKTANYDSAKRID